MPLTLRALGAALALMLIAAACSTEDDPEPEADPSTSPTTTTTTTEADAGDAGDAECSVPGYVATDAEEVTGGRAVALYASARGLAPTGSVEGDEYLPRFDRVQIDVTSASGPVPEDIRRSVLDSVGEAWGKGGPPKESGPHPFSLLNDTDSEQLYVLYRGAEQVSGTWSAERCGAPYNDGAEILTMTGEFTTLTSVQPMQTYVCDTEPSDEYARAASRLCRL